MTDTPSAPALQENTGIASRFERAMRLHQKGRLDEAERRYARILESDPDHADTLHLLGVLKSQRGQREEAEALVRKAIAIDPAHPVYHLNLGGILVEAEHFEDALPALNTALEIDNSIAKAHYLRGQTLLKLGKLDEAQEQLRRALTLPDAETDLVYREIMDLNVQQEDATALRKTISNALEAHPNDAMLHYHAANSLHAFLFHEDALPYYKKAAEIDPALIGAYCNWGLSLSKLGRPEEAKNILQQALRRRGDIPELYLTLSMIAHDEDELQESVNWAEKALEADPNFAHAYSAIARALDSNGMYEDAIAAYKKALDMDPAMYSALQNLGSTLYSMGFPEKSIEYYAKALELNSKNEVAYWNLSLSFLSIGQLDDGWGLYSYGFGSKQRQPYRPFPGLLWDGSSLKDKTIMVWREQGIGDDLRFSSMYGDIVAQAKKVIIETDARFVPLYQRTWPEAIVRPETNTSTGLGNMMEVDFDVTAPAALPATYLRPHIEDFPKHQGYLVPDPDRRATFREWLDSLGPGLALGFAWRSGKRNAVRSHYYTELEDWIELFKTPGIKLINLQYDNAAPDLEAFERNHGIKIHQAPGLDLYSDLDGAAALTKELDLVVSAGTSVADMAGALGVPVFIYTSAKHVIKLGTDYVPWYPSMDIVDFHPGLSPKEDYVPEVIKRCQRQIKEMQRTAS